MSKKQLLNESEIRRFMALANLEPLTDRVVNENFVGSGEGEQQQSELEEMYTEDPAETPESGMEPSGDMEMGGDLNLSPEQGAKLLELVGKALGLQVSASVDGTEGGDSDTLDLGDVDSSEESSHEEREEAGEEDSEEEGEEESEEDSEEEGEEDEEEQDELEETEQLALQEELIQKVLNRVSARLVKEINEAKKSGKDVVGKKKVSEEDTKKDSKEDKKKAAKYKMKKMKKKLAEANAQAPKATNSNGPKKGAGSATKGNWGVSEKVSDHEWKKGTSNRGDKMKDVTPSAEHITTHGKKNLAAMGGNKTE